jgi:hypothetical protein
MRVRRSFAALAIRLVLLSRISSSSAIRRRDFLSAAAPGGRMDHLDRGCPGGAARQERDGGERLAVPGAGPAPGARRRWPASQLSESVAHSSKASSMLPARSAACCSVSPSRRRGSVTLSPRPDPVHAGRGPSWLGKANGLPATRSEVLRKGPAAGCRGYRGTLRRPVRLGELIASRSPEDSKPTARNSSSYLSILAFFLLAKIGR